MKTLGRTLFLSVIFSLSVAGCNGGAANNNSGQSATNNTAIANGQNSASGTGQGSSANISGNSNSNNSLLGTGNVVPLIVDHGPLQNSPTNVSYITLTVCIPGSNSCKTIDHILVDSGSSGLRLISSTLNGLNLPLEPGPNNSQLDECIHFGYGYNWGPVALADIKIAGETALHTPVQILGTNGTDYASFDVPSDCSDDADGPLQNTVATFFANGIIGVNSIPSDANSILGPDGGARYFSCTSSGCSDTVIANSNQVGNPVANFSSDNNGVIFKLPAVANGGQGTLAGELVFGINTRSNNTLNTDMLYQGAEANLDTSIDTTFNNINYIENSLVDSGTSTLSFPDDNIPTCNNSSLAYFYCPASTLELQGIIASANGQNANPMTFEVVNAENALADPGLAAIPGIATQNTNQQFIWGLPTFYGHNVYVAIDGQPVPGSIAGPFVAYGDYQL